MAASRERGHRSRRFYPSCGPERPRSHGGLPTTPRQSITHLDAREGVESSALTLPLPPRTAGSPQLVHCRRPGGSSYRPVRDASVPASHHESLHEAVTSATPAEMPLWAVDQAARLSEDACRRDDGPGGLPSGYGRRPLAATATPIPASLGVRTVGPPTAGLEMDKRSGGRPG